MTREHSRIPSGFPLVVAALGASLLGAGAAAQTTGWTAVSAGEGHTCAFSAGGPAYCWGTGVLGDGRVRRRAAPAPVSGNIRFRSLSTSAQHTCGVDADGVAYCWGLNVEGELGSRTGDTCKLAGIKFSCSKTPVRVTGGHKFLMISAGARHTCGVGADGQAYCWGANDFGQLGTAAPATCRHPMVGIAYSCADTPMPVAGGHRFSMVGAGLRHTCGLTTTGTVLCWGRNDRGQLGTAAPMELCGELGQRAGDPCSREPVAITGTGRFVAVAVGSNHNCAVTGTGAVSCWGWNHAGQLGNGTQTDAATGSPVPTTIAGWEFSHVTAGAFHTCGVSREGAAYCWGNNDGYHHVRGSDAGQLGTDDRRFSLPAPVAVSGSLRFKTLSAGAAHTCGVTVDGSLYCWGANDRGQLGAGSRDGTSAPVLVGKSP